MDGLLRGGTPGRAGGVGRRGAGGRGGANDPAAGGARSGASGPALVHPELRTTVRASEGNHVAVGIDGNGESYDAGPATGFRPPRT
jgi:hypothetical protein